MISFEKTYGVRGVANDLTLLSLAQLICDYRDQCPVGKVKIDTEKMTFYKFGLKMGICRFAPNGLVVNEQGIIRDMSMDVPVIRDKEVVRALYGLFGKRCPL